MAVEYVNNWDEARRKIDEAIDKTLDSTGLFVESAAKLLSPVDTSRLRNSINHDVNLSKKRVTIGTNVEYAIYQEFGTRKMRAQSYLRPAAERNKATIKRVAEDAFKSVIGD